MFHRARSLSFLTAWLAGTLMWVLPAAAQTLPQQIAQYTFCGWDG